MAPSSTSTAFVLVPGGFCPAEFYNKVTERLRNKGYAVSPIDLPTNDGSRNPPASMYDDAAAIRSAAAAHMDKGLDVVVVGHGYGGLAACEAMKGLTEADRQASGKSGGRVANLVGFGFLFPRAGMNTHELVADHYEGIPPSEKDYQDPPPPEAFAGIMTDSPVEEQQHYTKMATVMATRAFSDRLTYEGYLHVPMTAVVVENDKAIAPATQHKQADEAIASGKGNIKKVSIAADHCAMISHPDEFVEMLLNV